MPRRRAASDWLWPVAASVRATSERSNAGHLLAQRSRGGHGLVVLARGRGGRGRSARRAGWRCFEAIDEIDAELFARLREGEKARTRASGTCSRRAGVGSVGSDTVTFARDGRDAPPARERRRHGRHRDAVGRSTCRGRGRRTSSWLGSRTCGFPRSSSRSPCSATWCRSGRSSRCAPRVRKRRYDRAGTASLLTPTLHPNTQPRYDATS